MNYGGYSRTTASNSNQSGGGGYGAAAPKPSTNRSKVRLRVSYNLQGSFNDQSQHQRHCFGINSLAFNDQDGLLYSAGRDSTVRCWDVNKLPVPEHVSCFEHHTDWVNDIFLCNNNKTMVSCSSDAAIKVWDTQTSMCTRTLNRHSDYVKALAYAPRADLFASGGLDANIFVWDLQQCTAPVVALPVNSSPSLNSSSGFRNNVAPIVRTGVDKGSLYSLAINSTASVILSGSTEKLVRAWDPRSGQKIFKLKGHTDNIKTLCVNDEGTLCVSGSSDFTLRLWDLRQQQCIHVFEIHDDSVWSVAADPTFTNVFSGGRDGSVFVTDLVSSHSTLVCNEQYPVVKLLHSTRGGDSLWVTTTDSCIKNWALEANTIVQRRVYSPPITLSSSPTTSSLQGPKPTPIVKAPCATILGRPGMIKHHIMNNRRHVLTKDSSGAVELWDITRAKQLESFGVVNFESKLEALTETVSVPNWFSVDTKTGSLTVHLDCPQCFSAEVYAGDIFDDLPPEDEEIQMNLGESVLRALFSYWEEGRRALETKQKQDYLQQRHQQQQTQQHTSSSSQHPHLPPISQPPLPLPQTHQLPQQLPPIQDRPQPNGVSHDTDKKTHTDSKDDTATEKPLSQSTAHLAPPPTHLGNSTHLSNSSNLTNSNISNPAGSPTLSHSNHLSNSTALTNSTALKSSSATANGPINSNNANNDTAQREPKIPTLTMPDSVSVIISEEGTGATIHRALRSQFVGDEPSEVIPPWVVDCLLHNEIPPMRANPKIGFYLVTADEKELPPLPQGNGRLSAHRLLRVRKVANYVVQKLELELPLLTDSGSGSGSGSGAKTENSDEKDNANGNGNGTENGTSSSESEGSDKNEERVPPEQYIDILCNNKVLSPTHSLATVKAFFWKSGDDIVLNYRINQKFADAEKKGSPRGKKNNAKNADKKQVGNALRKNNPFHRGK